MAQRDARELSEHPSPCVPSLKDPKEAHAAHSPTGRNKDARLYAKSNFLVFLIVEFEAVDLANL